MQVNTTKFDYKEAARQLNIYTIGFRAANITRKIDVVGYLNAAISDKSYYPEPNCSPVVEVSLYNAHKCMEEISKATRAMTQAFQIAATVISAAANIAAIFSQPPSPNFKKGNA